jgi:CxxC motif-containing protein
LKSKLKEAALTLGRLRVKPPIQAGQTILSNLLDTDADVIATDDLFD